MSGQTVVFIFHFTLIGINYQSLMKLFAEGTHGGSYIESNESALVWHNQAAGSGRKYPCK